MSRDTDREKLSCRLKIEKGTAKAAVPFSASCNDFEKPNQNFDLVLNKKVNPKRHLKSS